MKRFSYEPIHFEHWESEEFLEVFIDSKIGNEDLNQFVSKTLKEIHPEISNKYEFHLVQISEEEFYKLLEDCSPEAKKKLTTILKYRQAGVFETAYKVDSKDSDLSIETLLITDKEIVFVNWWSTA